MVNFDQVYGREALLARLVFGMVDGVLGLGKERRTHVEAW